ncbi:MAG TPA: ribosome biogenesis GTPase YqeH [Bacilli bacterium]|nr:ribosome biogenesis GTPase YqeH [Bacilli bacterium]
MTEIRKIRRCPGCGVILQSIDETLPGYVPEKHLAKHEVVICQRCFKLQHYGEDIAPKEPRVNEEFLRILDQAKAENALIIYVLDLFSFDSSFSPEINEKIQHLDIIGVANKRDLFPKSVKDEKLREYVLKRTEKAGLKVDALVIASPLKKYNIDELKSEIEARRLGRNVYVIGATSSGKSSLVNAYMKQFMNMTQVPITTSPFPGTTLRVIEIPLDDSSRLFDTPGYVIDSSLLSLVERDVIRTIVPRTEIKPRTYQLSPKQSVIVGGLARFDFMLGKMTGFTFYVSNLVELKRTALVNADKTFDSLVSKNKIRPTSKIVKGFGDLEAFEVDILDKGKLDIGIVGLGWVTFTASKQRIRILAPKGVHIFVQAAKI